MGCSCCTASYRPHEQSLAATARHGLMTRVIPGRSRSRAARMMAPTMTGQKRMIAASSAAPMKGRGKRRTRWFIGGDSLAVLWVRMSGRWAGNASAQSSRRMPFPGCAPCLRSAHGTRKAEAKAAAQFTFTSIWRGSAFSCLGTWIWRTPSLKLAFTLPGSESFGSANVRKKVP